MIASHGVTRISSDRDALERIVKHALALPLAFRKVVLLCDIQGLSVDETANILGISPAAVSVRLGRARRELNVRLAASS